MAIRGYRNSGSPGGQCRCRAANLDGIRRNIWGTRKRVECLQKRAIRRSTVWRLTLAAASTCRVLDWHTQGCLTCAKTGTGTAHRLDIIPRNGPKLSCEEAIPNAGKSHSTVRHGFAGRSFQYVPGFFSSLLIVLGLMSNSLKAVANSREAVQTAEDARAIAVKKIGEDSVAQGASLRASLPILRAESLGWVTG